jgi:cyclopropane fatty-acyl-phospholipid synthase-like methyltransferase
MNMQTSTEVARRHYEAADLLPSVKAALAAFGSEQTVLSVKQLAALDQFHTRGLLATADLANEMDLTAGMRVLDLGCGLGGPARYLAETHDVEVTGIDLSESFVATARYLSARCKLAHRTTFLVGEAIDPPVEPATFDRVFLQHVAMNIADRASLYAAIRRALKPGGKLGLYDIVAGTGELHFPLPWAKGPEGSHLLSMADTREALSTAGFRVELWRDDTQAAAQWFAAMQSAGPPAGPSLAVVLGADFPGMTGNLGRNLREARLGGVLMAVVTC